MSISRVATIIIAGLSSAASFYIITRSGLAGTLVGALVSGAVYNVTSLSLNQGLSKTGRVLKARGPQSEPVERGNDQGPSTQESPPPQRAAATRSGPTRWLPMALGAVALLVSVWAVTDDDGSTLIRERIVEQPVVKEKIVVQTVTVTPDAGPVSLGAAPQPTSGSYTTETSSSTTTAQDPSTSTTTETPTTGPPTTTTSTVHAPSEEGPANPGPSQETDPSP
ncbi:MAG: hypothetical protein GXX83_04880 [Gaiellales bacterium]|nr:hypothetical protein [Gaiellales bacterium]